MPKKHVNQVYAHTTRMSNWCTRLQNNILVRYTRLQNDISIRCTLPQKKD